MSSVTLYRKYRPQSFGEIVNQDHVKAAIKSEIISEQLPHAFLFSGPRGVGKTTMARVLAKALNCPKRKKDSAEPCNKCEVCESVGGGKSLNLVEVDAASQTGVDNVRDNIIANARVAVNSGEYKVFIIDEVHMLSTSSFNALLKTLEEPPARVVFVLATTEIHKIPETIISRCQRFDFHPVKSNELKEYLAGLVKQEKREVSDDVLSAIVKKSGGHVRDAISLLGQILTLPGKVGAQEAGFILPIGSAENVITFFDFVSKNKAADAMLHLGKLEQDGIRPFHFCGDLIDFAHKMMLMNVGSHPDIFSGEVGDDQMDTIKEICSGFSSDDLLNIIDVLMKRRLQLKNYDQGYLPLELAVVEICSVGQSGQAGHSFASPSASAARNSDADAPVSPGASAAPTSAPPSPSPAPSTPAQPGQVKKKHELKLVRPDSKSEASQAAAASRETAPQNDGQLASFSELKSVWNKAIEGLYHEHHSLCIVMKTCEMREGDDVSAELAFRFSMHHDHVKSSLNKIIDQFKKHLPDKRISFRLVVDEQVTVSLQNEVDEPNKEEKESLKNELTQLADAFGGSIIE